jgi:peptidoglycan/xylan/chitin deacetylase (PgdA/CDA1 family)
MRNIRVCFILIFLLGFFLLCTTIKKKDERPFSSSPPSSLKVHQVPLFVVFGFDDNGISGLDKPKESGGVKFITDVFASRYNPPGSGNKRTYDGTQTHFSMYCTTQYIAGEEIDNPVLVKRAWKGAMLEGNEIGIHTHLHSHGSLFRVEEWEREIQACIDWLIKPYDPQEFLEEPDPAKGIGIDRSDIYGFRAPYLEYNNNALQAAFDKGLLYDTSIEEGFEDDQDGTNYFWPYRLHDGRKGKTLTPLSSNRKRVSNHPDFWEIPIYAVIVPPDSHCIRYGVKPGFRKKMEHIQDYFKEDSGKISGLDWNLLNEFEMTKEEFLATLKYTFDMRLQGNRCPFIFGAHSDMYSQKYKKVPNITVEERQQALIEFIDYILTFPDIRIISAKELIDWMKAPSALR